MFEKEKFTMTEEHLKLLQRMCITYQGDCEFGAPEVNPKRPYGNSDVYDDIAIIIGIRKDYEDCGENNFTDDEYNRMKTLHRETGTALQVALSVQGFEIGEYEADKYTSNWKII